MAAQTHKIRVGETLVPFKFQLKYLDDTTGLYVPYDLSGKTVFMFLEDEEGNDVLTGTVGTVQCTVTSATSGKGEYDFKSTDVETAGLYYMYIVVYSSNERVSFPNEEKQLRLLIQD